METAPSAEGSEVFRVAARSGVGIEAAYIRMGGVIVSSSLGEDVSKREEHFPTIKIM